MIQKLKISPRDIELFNYLFSAKVAARHQIYRDIFDDKNYPNAARRLKKLWNEQYIDAKAHHYSDGRIVKIFGLARRGRRVIGVSGQEKDLTRNQIVSDSVGHDLALVNLQRRLLRFQMVTQYVSENSFLSKKGLLPELLEETFENLRPDAALGLVFRQKEVFLPFEYEATLKAKARCVEKLVRYHFKPDVPVVLFVCENQRIYKRFYQIERDLHEKYGAKIYFALASKVIFAEEKLVFRNPNGDAIILK